MGRLRMPEHPLNKLVRIFGIARLKRDKPSKFPAAGNSSREFSKLLFVAASNFQN
jgi:hypothetical protein